MRVGYCSPFNPMKSGISDFSEELAIALAEHMEIVIFSPVMPENKAIQERFECHLLDDLDREKLRASLDVIVYHIGNNGTCHGAIVDMLEKYPGVVELHDVGLHHLFAEHTLQKKGQAAYLELIRYCHGERGLQCAQAFFQGTAGAPWDTQGLELCMNRLIIEQATAVIVHSDMAKQMVLGVRPDVPVAHIMLHSDVTDNSAAYKRQCRERLAIPMNRTVCGSFGFATRTKRIIPILDALKLAAERDRLDFLYLIVGEAHEDLELARQIQARGLEGNVQITGFTDLDTFKAYIGACDFCLNLRYPTLGESSASLHRMLGMGKPVIVTDIGTFSEYPDEIAQKIRYDSHEVDDIYQAVCTQAKGGKSRSERRSQAALQFARENCDVQKNALRYKLFFEQVLHATWQPDFCDVMAGRLCELGLTERTYTQHIGELLFHL